MPEWDEAQQKSITPAIEVWRWSKGTTVFTKAANDSEKKDIE